MNNTSMVNELTDQLSNLTPSELNQVIIQAAKYVKRANTLLKTAKTVWAETHTGGDSEDATRGGQLMGTISLSKGGDTTYKVVDPQEYAAALKAINSTLSDGQTPAWETRIMPRVEACTNRFIDRLVRDYDGEIPDGVELTTGRGQTVTVRLDPAYNLQPLNAFELVNPVTFQIETSTKHDEQ